MTFSSEPGTKSIPTRGLISPRSPRFCAIYNHSLFYPTNSLTFRSYHDASPRTPRYTTQCPDNPSFARMPTMPTTHPTTSSLMKGKYDRKRSRPVSTEPLPSDAHRNRKLSRTNGGDSPMDLDTTSDRSSQESTHCEVTAIMTVGASPSAPRTIRRKSSSVDLRKRFADGAVFSPETNRLLTDCI